MTEHRDDAAFREILEQLRETGFKKSPLRLAYEREVHDLARVRRELERAGVSQAELARRLHGLRRACGKRFKEASPPLVREYVYYATARKYGDPLGPDYDALRRRKTDAEIIESASRPIRDLDDRLNEADFRAWYEEVYCKEKG